MAEVIQTQGSGPDRTGPSIVAVVIAVLVIVLLLFGAWWLFISDSSPIRSNTTNINIEQKGGTGGTGGSGSGTGGSSTTSTSP